MHVGWSKSISIVSQIQQLMGSAGRFRAKGGPEINDFPRRILLTASVYTSVINNLRFQDRAIAGEKVKIEVLDSAARRC